MRAFQGLRLQQAPAECRVRGTLHWKSVPRQRRRRVTTIAHAVECEEYDVVVFDPKATASSQQQTQSTSAALTVGCITFLSEDEGVAVIEELTPDDEADSRPGFKTFIEAGCEYEVPLLSVMKVLDADYSQRMDANRVANPHGEHAHGVWEISEDLELP